MRGAVIVVVLVVLAAGGGSAAEDGLTAGDVSVAGDKAAASDVKVAGDKSVAGDEQAAGDGSSIGDKSAAGDVSVAGDKSAAGDVSVAGDKSVSGDKSATEDKPAAGDESATGDETPAADESTAEDGVTNVEETAGTKMLSTLDKTLLGIQNSLYKGMTAMGTPAVKFTVDTVPHLVHIYALVQGVVVHPKLVAMGKEAVSRLALIAGTVGSDAAVLGSSVLNDVSKMTAAALEAQNDIAAKMGDKGIKMAGHVIESLINVTSIGVDAAAIGLTALGDTLVSAAEVNGAMSGASARLLTAIGACLERALLAAQQGYYTLASPILGVSARLGQTTNVASYLSTLKSAQKVLDRLVDASLKTEAEGAQSKSS